MQQHDSTVTDAVILAGGRSTRMGEDKAFLMHEGQPLWQRLAQTLAAAGCTQLWLSSRREQELQAPVEAWSADNRIPVRWLFDPPVPASPGQRRGPLNVLAELWQQPLEVCVLFAVDLPFVRPDFIKQLRRQYAEAAAPCSIITMTEDGLQPLASLYHRSIEPCLKQALEEPKAPSLNRILRAAAERGLAKIWCPPPSFHPQLTNWNTPEDRARFLS